MRSPAVRPCLLRHLQVCVCARLLAVRQALQDAMFYLLLVWVHLVTFSVSKTLLSALLAAECIAGVCTMHT